jgi:hypothetical protein
VQLQAAADLLRCPVGEVAEKATAFAKEVRRLYVLVEMPKAKAEGNFERMLELMGVG